MGQRRSPSGKRVPHSLRKLARNPVADSSFLFIRHQKRFPGLTKRRNTRGSDGFRCRKTPLEASNVHVLSRQNNARSMTEADVCIVGGGIMGLATARALATASKLQILIVDRYGVGNEYCASNDSSRMFCFANGARERYTRMAIESLRLWRE